MLSAIADLFGPIFAKELIEMARRLRYYLSRILFGSILLLVLFIVYEESHWSRRSWGPIKAMAYLAEEFFLSVLWVQYCAVYFFVPLFLSGGIAGEREQKTLELLFTTTLTDREIILSKLGSRMTAIIVLILAGLPVISITMLFGGVNPHILWRALVATLVAVLFASACSIYFSTKTKSPLGALIRTYWWMGLWSIALPYLTALLFFVIVIGRDFSVRAQEIMQMVMCSLALINPLSAFAAAVSPEFGMIMTRFIGSWYFSILLIVPVCMALLLLWLSVRALRIEPGPSKAWLRVKSVFRWTGRLLARPFMGSKTKAATARSSSRHADRFLHLVPIDNPLWLRARRAWVYDRERHIGRIQLGGWLLVIVIVGILVFAEPRALRDDDAGMGFSSVAWIGLGALACLIAGSSVVGERRRGFFDLVLVTPMTPGEIIGGTFLSIWRHVKKTHLLLIALGILFMVTGACKAGGTLVSFVTGSLTVALFILHGIAFSVAARTMPGALVSAFIFPIILLLGTAFLIGFARGGNGPALWILCAVCLPLSWLLVRRKLHVATVCFFLTFVHLSMAALVSCWTYSISSNNREFPLAAMHAGALTIMPLEKRAFEHGRLNPFDWVWIYLGYWFVLVLNLLWLVWWLCRNFERLCGRTDGKIGRRKSE